MKNETEDGRDTALVTGGVRELSKGSHFIGKIRAAAAGTNLGIVVLQYCDKCRRTQKHLPYPQRYLPVTSISTPALRLSYGDIQHENQQTNAHPLQAWRQWRSMPSRHRLTGRKTLRRSCFLLQTPCCYSDSGTSSRAAAAAAAAVFLLFLGALAPPGVAVFQGRVCARFRSQI